MNESHIILFIVILALFFMFCDKITYEQIRHENKTDKVCRRLHINNDNKKYTIVKNLVDKDFCIKMIDDSESYALKNEWKKKRHDAYCTTDNEITKSWNEYDYIKNNIVKQIASEIGKLYNINRRKIGINEIFIVKYDISGQKSLDYHKDGSEFSFVIGLNEDYTGGGTTFKFNNETVKLDTGDCLIFSGQNRHKGNELTSGKRYILTGFLNYGGNNYCENFMNDLK